jgi:hypothetical protein
MTVLADREVEGGAKSHDSKTAWFSELIIGQSQQDYITQQFKYGMK